MFHFHLCGSDPINQETTLREISCQLAEVVWRGVKKEFWQPKNRICELPQIN